MGGKEKTSLNPAKTGLKGKPLYLSEEHSIKKSIKYFQVKRERCYIEHPLDSDY